MNRLYAIESSPSSTGSMADHRIATPPGRSPPWNIAFGKELARLLPGRVPAPLSDLLDRGRRRSRSFGTHHSARSSPCPRELGPDRGAAIAAGHSRADPTGQSVHSTERSLRGGKSHPRRPKLSSADHGRPGRDLDRGDVDTLLILGSNPVHTAPADLDFASKLSRVPNSIELGVISDETTAHTTWFIPETHYLESWGDAARSMERRRWCSR